MDEHNQPATKGDLSAAVEQLRTAAKQDVEQLRTDVEQGRTDARRDIEQLRSEMNHQYNDLVERISDSETKLLNAFYSFANTNQKRLLEVEGNEAALRSRLATVETRLLDVEKRLNIPPAA